MPADGRRDLTRRLKV